jgi:hypothetical protein
VLVSPITVRLKPFTFSAILKCQFSDESRLKAYEIK